MLNLLFNAPQNYAWALNYGRRLLEDETKDMEKNRTEHQINTRIYNNAFCGLLRTEYPFEVISINNQIFLRLVIDNITFQCPSNTVSNILRQEYDTLVKPKVDAYIQMESDKASQPVQSEQSEQRAVVSESDATPAKAPETSPNEDPASSVTSVPNADVLQNKESSDHEDSSLLKTGEISDELRTKITPQKQMEMMRELTKGQTVGTPKENTQKKEGSAAKENSTPKQTALDMKNDPGDGDKRKNGQSLHRMMMTAPNLDDIIFAPIVTHKKVVEIGEDSAKPSSDTEADSQDKTDTAMEKETEAQAPETPISIEEDKESSGQQTIETATDDVKTERIPELADDKDKITQSEPATNDTSSSPLSEAEKLSDETAATDQPEVSTEQLPVHQEQAADAQPSAESEDTQVPAASIISGQSSKRMFQPKAQRFAPKTAPSADVIAPASSEGQMNPKERKGFLSALFGGEKRREAEVIAPALNPALTEKGEDTVGETEAPASAKIDLPAQTDNTPAEVLGSSVQAKEEAQTASEDIKTESYNHDGGKIFSHIHQVALKKQFGNSSAGPYRFIFWPLRIIEMQSKKTWADFLVHVTDQNGNETVLCTDGAYKELIVKVDGKEFNVYATWTNGVFDSHVSLYGKTASIYTIEEEVYREEPEEAEHDSFLDQFRLERKGQPKHFIVPFKNNNRGELNIPIVGCVELGGKRYPLERREENTLRYRYNGSDKVIRGHWEKGAFQFSVEDVNRFIWEDQDE